MHPWVTSPAFVVEPLAWPSVKPVVSPWAKPADPPAIQAYQTDEKLKQAYGIELAKCTNPFEAGCKVFGEETSKALWASFNWLTDPIVVASRDIYLKNIELNQKPLDREQLAAKVLALAEGEKVLVNGVMRSTIEAKDRATFFKLYSDILGYTGKVEIDNSKNVTFNELTIKLVKPEDSKPVKTIDNAPNVKSEIFNTENIPTIKLVKSA